MALNIAVTSKFDPFTQEDYIKPLANYWKEYEKYEDALFAENAKLAALDPYLGYFTDEDAELRDQYDKYKQSLESARDQMSQGLNAQTRRQIRGDILPMYGSHIVPIQEAFQKKAAAITEYQKQAAHNPSLLSSEINPLNMSVSSFYGMNNGAAGYFTEDGNKIQDDFQKQAASYSSSVTKQTQTHQGNQTISETQTGSIVPIISFDSSGNLLIGNEDQLQEEVVDKLRKMYEDGKTIYRYNELDEASQHKFNSLFIKGIENGWVNKKVISTEPFQENYTQVFNGEPFVLTRSDGTEAKAQPFTKRNGAVVYLLDGTYYTRDALERMQEKENTNKQKDITENAVIGVNFNNFENETLAPYYDVNENDDKNGIIMVRDFRTQNARANNTSRKSSDFVTDIITEYNPGSKEKNIKVAFDAALYALLDREFEDMFDASNNKVAFTTNIDYANIWGKDDLWGWAITFDGRGFGNQDLHDAKYIAEFTFDALNHKVWGSLPNDERRLDEANYGKFVAAYVKQRLPQELEANTAKIDEKLDAIVEFAMGRALEADNSTTAKDKQITFFNKVKQIARSLLIPSSTSKETSQQTQEYTGSTGFDPTKQ